jgi:hypothetical protein
LSRKEKLKYKEELKALAAEHVPTAVDTLAKLTKDKNVPASARVAASSAILDRFAGRPSKPEDKLSPEHELEKLSPPQLVQRICDDIARFPVEVRAAIAQALIAADKGLTIDIGDFLEVESEPSAPAADALPPLTSEPKKVKIPRR